MAYGQTNVNGGSRGGEFLTGNLNFFQLITVVPCYPTKVTAPLAQALKARNWTSLSASRTITIIDGNGASQTYTSNAGYEDAFNKQANLTALLNTFAIGANPVIVAVSTAAIADGQGATVLSGGVNAVDFGSTYNGAQTGYFINLATERNPAWLMDTSTVESNANGYQLLNAINGVPVLDTSAVSVAGGTFVVSSSSNNRNIIGKVREEL
jgi:hypothetical protein